MGFVKKSRKTFKKKKRVKVKTEPEDPGYSQVLSENYQDTRDLTRSFSLPARELEQQPVERQLSLDRARQHQGGNKEEGGSSRTIIGSRGGAGLWPPICQG